MKEIELSVIIPTFNEEENLSHLLSQLKQIITQITTSFEIIIIDGGSKDKTREVAKAQGAEVILQTTPGYGGAIKEGINISRGKYLLTLDADLSHPPTFIYKMWNCKNKAEIIVASRYIPGGIAQMPLARKILSIALNRVYHRLLSLPVDDLSSGFRLYQKDIFTHLNLESINFDILEEILVKAYISGYRVFEIPFIYKPRRVGKSHVKLIKFFFSFAITLYKMWKIRNTCESCDYDERAYSSIIFFQRWWQRKRHSIIINWVFKQNLVLDIGCGSSRILNTIPRAVGVDVDMKKLRYIRKYGNPLVGASIFALPFKKNTFDGVICSEVIEHIKFDEKIWEEISYVLKPGGVLVMGTLDYASKIWLVIEKLYKVFIPAGYGDKHITHYTYPSILEILPRYGFELKGVKYIFFSEMILYWEKK